MMNLSRESLHECQSDVEALRLVYENYSTGTSKACASFAMVSEVLAGHDR
jgi:hypothetical protein